MILSTSNSVNNMHFYTSTSYVKSYVYMYVHVYAYVVSIHIWTLQELYIFPLVVSLYHPIHFSLASSAHARVTCLLLTQTLS